MSCAHLRRVDSLTADDSPPCERRSQAAETSTENFMTQNETTVTGEGNAPRDNGPKFPHIEVRLVGSDSNAFAIMGKVSQALRRAGVAKADRDAFFAEATSGDYDNVIATAMRWVNVS